jgi:hypothetical protein
MPKGTSMDDQKKNEELYFTYLFDDKPSVALEEILAWLFEQVTEQ